MKDVLRLQITNHKTVNLCVNCYILSISCDSSMLTPVAHTLSYNSMRCNPLWQAPVHLLYPPLWYIFPSGYPSGRPGSRTSDYTHTSSSDGSPVHQPARRQRPRSMAGLTPNYSPAPSYASPTVSSTKRLGRDTQKKVTGN